MHHLESLPRCKNGTSSALNPRLTSLSSYFLPAASNTGTTFPSSKSSFLFSSASYPSLHFAARRSTVHGPWSPRRAHPLRLPKEAEPRPAKPRPLVPALPSPLPPATELTVAVCVVVAGVASAVVIRVLLIVVLLGLAVVACIAPLVAVRIALVWVPHQRAVVLEVRAGWE